MTETPIASRRQRRASIFVAATAGIVIVSALIIGVDWRSREPPTSLGLLAPSLSGAVGKAHRILVQSAQRTLTIQRTGEDWGLVERGGFRLAPTRVGDVLRALSKVDQTRLMTRDKDRLALVGLDDPAEGGSGVRLRVFDERGAVLGDVTFGYPPGGSVFARRGDDAQAYSVRGAPARLDQLSVWLDLQLLDWRRGDLRMVSVSPTVGPGYNLERTSPANDFTIAAPFDRLAVIAPIGVSATAHALVSLAPSDVAAANQISGPVVGRVRVETFSGLGVSATILQQGFGYWLTVSAYAATPSAQPGADALNARLAPWAFAISAQEAQALSAPLESLARYGR